MEYERKILFNFTSYLLLGLLICLIGLSNVFALEDYENLGYIDNYTLYYVVAPLNGTETPQLLPQNQEWNLENNVSAFILNIDNYNFDANVNYNIEISMPLSTLTNANTYTVITSNNTTCNVGIMDLSNPHYPNFSFKCPVATNSIALKIFNSNSSSIVNAGWFRWNYTYLRKLIDKNDVIIEGQEQIKDAIIESNKETQDVIKEQFNSCRPSKNLLSNGFYQRYETTVYTTIDNLSTGTYTFSYDGPLASQLTVRQIINGVGTDISYIYNSNKITFHLSNSFSGEVEIYVYSGVNVNDIKNAMLNEGSVAISYEPYGEEVCSNRIDETNDKLDETNDKLNDIEGALTDSSPTDMSGLGDSAGWLPPGPVDSILNLPLTFFLNLSESLDSECRTVDLTLPFVNEKIYLPCIRTLYDKMGVTGTIFTTAGVIASAIILFNYLLALYKWVDDTLTMRENTMPGYYEDNWGGGA